ncbi:Hcp family type VI secretion system effector [Burkholderia guangdongensis]|uniref:Hcp family type VI secretion system effector n=1 Tax=Burkholderia guangdongensis TaxID=1792500 RepID=UPI0015C98080|nr:type VI secretion system tube protein Hcp [Burkholderia guangdongensis]
MAVDIFIKMTDSKGELKGESRDDKHKDQIDVLAWSWGMSNSGSAHMGGGAGAGKANVQDLSFTKYVDKATPGLLRSCVTGDHFTKVELFVRKAGGKPLEYIKVEMDEVIVTSISSGGSGGEDRLTENVTLNFAKFTYTYTPQKPDGSGDTEIPFTYDIAVNKEG